MNIALIQCPAWIVTSPPYALGILTSLLAGEPSFTVRGYDLNIRCYHHAIRHINPVEPSVWNPAKIDHFWCDPEHANQIYSGFSPVTADFFSRLEEFEPQVFCFSLQYSSLYFSYQLTRAIKDKYPHSTIIWGGPYCFHSNGNLRHIVRTMKEVDIICTGDAGENFVRLLRSFEKSGGWEDQPGFILSQSAREQQSGLKPAAGGNIEELPVADYRLFENRDYSWEYCPVAVSRGCNNRCAFCNECLSHKKYEFRSPQSILGDIIQQKHLHPQIRTFWLTCSNIAGDLPALADLCSRIKKELPDIKWVTQMAVTPKHDPRIFDLLKEAGCTFIHFGIESGSDSVLALMNKGYTRKSAVKTIKSVIRRSIGFNINFVVGFPGESNFDFLKTLFLLQRYLKYGLYPSVADCKILYQSSIYNFPDRFGIVNPRSPEWKTRDGKNTLPIRLLRRQIAESLYHSDIKNAYHLSGRIHKSRTYFLHNKQDNLKNSFIIAGLSGAEYLADSISYLFFLPWIVYISIKLSYKSFIEKKRSLSEDRMLDFKISEVKDLLFRHLSGSKQDFVNGTKNTAYNIEPLIEKVEKLLDQMEDPWERLRFLKNASRLPAEELSQELNASGAENSVIS